MWLRATALALGSIPSTKERRKRRKGRKYIML